MAVRPILNLRQRPSPRREPGVFNTVLTPSAHASPILFDFNALSSGINSASPNGANPTGTDPIEAYLENLYGSHITVNLGAQTRNGRVEGRPSGLYLGNSDYAVDRGAFATPPGHPNPKDTFLINRWNATSLASTKRDRIVITFEEVPIIALAVDWEIFPVTQNGQNADITIKADGSTIFYQALFGADKELGDLGRFVSVSFATPVRTLEFIDWSDAPIGIDNLRVTPVPEPASLLLLGSGLAGLGLWRRSRRGGAQA
jgi:hypothetical protein